MVGFAQQDIQAVHRIRAELAKQRTAKANQIRGLVAEYGLVAPKEMMYLRRALPCWLGDAAVGNGAQFANGRQMSAAFGLTPRQHSSSGKERLLGISKRGDVYLRSLLIHGARAVIRTAKDKDDRLSEWVTRLAARSHPKVAAVALANKTTRMAWAMLKNGTDYQPDRVTSCSNTRRRDRSTHVVNRSTPTTIAKQAERWQTGQTIFSKHANRCTGFVFSVLRNRLQM
jgi:transposase